MRQLKIVRMETSLNGVRNLMFDLGGVIIDLDRQRCVDALVALGDSHADELLGLSMQKGEFMKLEEGKISAADFYNEMRRRIGRPVSDNEITDAINELLISIPVERLRLLRELKQHFKVMLLSNTNSIMFDTKIADCFAQEGLSVSHYFNDIFLSYRLKACKPHAEIFEKVIAQAQIIPEETLFFDDSQQNLDTAAALGFKTYLVTPDRDILSFFKTNR